MKKLFSLFSVLLVLCSANAAFGPSTNSSFPLATSTPAGGFLIFNITGDTNYNLAASNALAFLNSVSIAPFSTNSVMIQRVTDATNDLATLLIVRITNSTNDLNQALAARITAATNSGNIAFITGSGFTLGAYGAGGLTNLNATELRSGTVAAARLGSGSGGSTKFLREDSSWQTVSGGSGWPTLDGRGTNPIVGGRAFGVQITNTANDEIKFLSEQTGATIATFNGGGITASTFIGGGSALTGLAANELTSGTVARPVTNSAVKTGDLDVTNNATISGNLSVAGESSYNQMTVTNFQIINEWDGSRATNVSATSIKRSTNFVANVTLIDLTKMFAYTNHTANFTITGFTPGTYDTSGTNAMVVTRMFTNNSVGAKTITMPSGWIDIGSVGNPVYNTNIGQLGIIVVPNFITNYVWSGK